MGDDENAAGRRLGGAYAKRLRMLGTTHPPKRTGHYDGQPAPTAGARGFFASTSWLPFAGDEGGARRSTRIPQRSEIRLLIRHFEVKKSAMVGNLVWWLPVRVQLIPSAQPEDH
jgi:hypothetical protein